MAAIILHSFFFVDPQRLNDAVTKTFSEEHHTINSELLRIEKLYGITYEARVIRTLYMWIGQDMEELIWEISDHFHKNNEPVPLDVILLHQITLKTGIIGSWYRNPNSWNHPRPNRILYHIGQYETDSQAATELIESLSILIHLANLSHADYYPDLDMALYSEFLPVRRRHLAGYPFPQEIMDDLRDVWNTYNQLYCQNEDCIEIPKLLQI